MQSEKPSQQDSDDESSNKVVARPPLDTPSSMEWFNLHGHRGRGKSTTRRKANDKVTQTFRHQPEAGGRSYDERTGLKRKLCQPEHKYWRDDYPALAQAA